MANRFIGVDGKSNKTKTWNLEVIMAVQFDKKQDRGFMFFRNYYNLGKEMSEHNQMKLYYSILRYLYDGITPTFSRKENEVKIAFNALLFTLNAQLSGKKKSNPAGGSTPGSTPDPALPEKEKEKKILSCESIKENEFSLKDETFSLPVDFTRWTQIQFVASVDGAIAQHPELAPFREQFVGYWTEPDKRGKMRFSREKHWETCSRMKTSLSRAKTHGNGTNGDSNGTGQIDFADEIRKIQEI